MEAWESGPVPSSGSTSGAFYSQLPSDVVHTSISSNTAASDFVSEDVDRIEALIVEAEECVEGKDAPSTSRCPSRMSVCTQVGGVPRCSICFADPCARGERETTTTPCSHTFCTSCLQSAVRRDPRCPNCRHPLPRDPGESRHGYADVHEAARAYALRPSAAARAPGASPLMPVYGQRHQPMRSLWPRIQPMTSAPPSRSRHDQARERQQIEDIITDVLSRPEYEALRQRYEAISAEGASSMLPPPTNFLGWRGRLALRSTRWDDLWMHLCDQYTQWRQQYDRSDGAYWDVCMQLLQQSLKDLEAAAAEETGRDAQEMIRLHAEMEASIRRGKRQFQTGDFGAAIRLFKNAMRLESDLRLPQDLELLSWLNRSKSCHCQERQARARRFWNSPSQHAQAAAAEDADRSTSNQLAAAHAKKIEERERKIQARNNRYINQTQGLVINDKKFLLAVVKRDGRQLQYASEELRRDKEVVLAAVMQHSDAFQYASQALRDDSTLQIIAGRGPVGSHRVLLLR